MAFFILQGRISGKSDQPLHSLSLKFFSIANQAEINPVKPVEVSEKGVFKALFSSTDLVKKGSEKEGFSVRIEVLDGDKVLAEDKVVLFADKEVNVDFKIDKVPVKPAEPKLTKELQGRLNLFKEVIKSVNLGGEIPAFEKLFEETKGNFGAIKTGLEGNPKFAPAILKNLDFTNRLAGWGNDNVKLVKVFHEDKDTNSMQDIALKFKKADFIEKVKDTAPAGADKVAFATDQYRKLFHIEPTAMLINMAKDPAVPILNDANGINATRILEKQPEFNIKTTSVYELLNKAETFADIPVESHEPVKIQLKNLQRIAAVSPVPEAVPALFQAEIRSAQQISAMPRAQFKKLMSSKGLDEKTIEQLHDNAQNVQVRNEHFMIAIREASQETGVAMIDKSLRVESNSKKVANASKVEAKTKSYAVSQKAQEILAQNNLSWNLLFGDADICECGECTSVYSAASYFVELLQYLRNNNLDNNQTGVLAIKTNPKDISGTPLEQFFRRRPDLGCLELTCKNTNTILPYIDLVNEVMENYVAFKHLKPFNVEDETTSELLSEPQHTEYQAYCILKNAVYPFTLPYHQPIDAARIYWKYLDTSRYEIINTFRRSNAGDDATLKILKDDALDRAADAEFLGMTKEEYVILTKECFETKALMDRMKNRTLTDLEYQEMIGVKPVSSYYGFGDDEAAMLGDGGLTLIKKEFLRRTGIDYFNLVDLLRTEFINPNLPKGRWKTIMESLRFSYRFLQNYARANGIDKLAEALSNTELLLDLLPQLEGTLTLFTKEKDKESLACPPVTSEENEITKKDIQHWVKCQFERVGKMIVIESGRECIKGEIFPKAKKSTFVRFYILDCIVYQSDGKKWYGKEIGKFDKKTGELIINSDQFAGDIKQFEALYFEGVKGEKGSFYILEGKLFLVLHEQKDSCDLETAQLQHLDGTPLTVAEYDRIHRFLRLWRKLGWTIDETDKAIAGLSKKMVNKDEHDSSSDDDSLCGDCPDDECKDETCNDCEEEKGAGHMYDINPLLIHQVGTVKHLLERTGLDLIRLLSIWTPISVAGVKSLYERLFLTHNLSGIDSVFKADANGNYLTGDAKISDHLPVLMAAFNLSADDLNAIRINSGMDEQISLTNLSIFYRHRLLSKALGLRMPAFIGILPLFGEVFGDASATLNFMDCWSRMEEAGFTHAQLNFLVRDLDDEKKPITPAPKTVLMLSKSLYDGLNSIDTTHQDLQEPDILEHATTELVNAKASLLFDTSTVGKIIGLLEGTSIYTTNAPKNLEIVLPDTSLKTKFLYSKTLGSIQVTGILTEAEELACKALITNTEWNASLARIRKQQNRLFKELLSGVFGGEKSKTPEEKAVLETVIMSGDVRISLEQVPEGDPNPNTAPQKRKAFLEIFLPYLRQQLTHRFIVDTLSGFSGLETNVTDVLVSEVLRLGTPSIAAIEIFEKIKESSNPGSTNWKGYLIPPSDGEFTFIVRDQGSEPVGVNLNGNMLTFHQQEDPTNEWWSDAVELQGGHLYPFLAPGLELKNVYWKTATAAISAIPSSALIPDFASENCGPALKALKKSAILVAGFRLDAGEIRFLQNTKDEFDGLDFNALTLEQWKRMDGYCRLRNSLPKSDLNLIDFLNWANADSTDPVEQAARTTELSSRVAELTNWKKAKIDQFLADGHFNIGLPSDFRNEKNLLKLQSAFQVAEKTGLDVDQLFQWAKPTSKFNKCRDIADGIKNAIRARYNQTDWEQVVKPLHDELRNNQKEALIAYLLQQPDLIGWGVTDADGLFEFFLIDVQMDACMETSRIKQAISSVQLFVQRCFLGLEEDFSKIPSELLDRDRWEWMERYRVWEANRKVFLYPENWIESNLRDDKSPFFKELEGELLQKDINKQNVTDALKSYLYKVDEVANMEVVGLYIDGTRTGIAGDPNQPITWTPGAKLHVFSRTRNAPYFFYYRYLELETMNWYPWEKMQVDIPSYDAEIKVTLGNPPKESDLLINGCYLTPVAWNGRLLVFFPQILKKSKPNQNSPRSGKFSAAGETDIANSLPVEFYEIKMAWSEYRNGKWTQKQISEVILSIDVAIDAVRKRRIDQFTFIPVVEVSGIIIHVEDQVAVDTLGFKGFTFNGSQIVMDKEVGVVANNLPSPIENEFGVTTFQKSAGAFKSLQVKNNIWDNDDVQFQVNASSIKFSYTNAGINDTDFYLSSTHAQLGKINSGRLDDFFAYDPTVSDSFYGEVSGQSNFHELKHPYSIYNWELLFHTPILLADALSKAQKFEEAAKWFHFVFDPKSGKGSPDRYWRFYPFTRVKSQRILDNIFSNLQPGMADITISEWRDKPFMPHVVARNRPVAYMKWVVMKYIDNLLAWGDYLYRQDTIESINQATQLYILAGHILGPRPMTIPKRGRTKPQTYLSLLDKWDAFGNAMVELELTSPFSNQTALPIGKINGDAAFANVFGLSTSLYFCIPNNPKLMGYWDTLADRLFKIRHCQNIEGVFRKLPLFEPPIDPALLVRAAAQGISIASVLNDLNTPLPNYRFYYLLQKALEVCGELKSMGAALLSAIEKKDGESISFIRAKHEGVMQNLVMEIKKKQLEEAAGNLESLEQNRKAPEHRMKYYLGLIGEDTGKVPGLTSDFSELANSIEAPVEESGLKLIKYEKEDMDKASDAAGLQDAIGKIESLASLLHVIPDFSTQTQPFGVGLTLKLLSGNSLGNATQAIAKWMQTDASELSFASSSAAKKGGFQRAMQDRIMQANAAGYEIKQIDKQITSQKIRIDIANKEIANQQKSIDNSQEIEEFLKDKYTNEELYTWMRGNLKTLYHQVYSLAYELAKKAEKVYRFERGLSFSNFIQSGYWDSGRDGLLAGEQLYVGLKQLEAAYQNERGYDYEISKSISLQQINPLALLQLRESGVCEFEFPEVWFDLDYPGHYRRRIKTLSVSIPCIAGPHTSVSATLRLMEHKFRNTAIGGKTYAEDTEETDSRFSTYNIPINAIATSSGQNDSGMFELNFKDERYLPFEGAGVVSRWRLELPPKFRQFDYNTIADVVCHMRYTSSEGGESLKVKANKSVTTQLTEMRQALSETGFQSAISMKADLPNEWQSIKRTGTSKLTLSETRMPALIRFMEKKSIREVLFIARTPQVGVHTIELDGDPVTLNKVSSKSNFFKGESEAIKLDKEFNLSVPSDFKDSLEELWLVISYTF